MKIEYDASSYPYCFKDIGFTINSFYCWDTNVTTRITSEGVCNSQDLDEGNFLELWAYPDFIEIYYRDKD